MIIRFIDDRGYPDHITLFSRDIENNPDLIEWTMDELYAQGCNDFELWNPTWEELQEEIKNLHTQISERLNNDT